MQTSSLSLNFWQLVPFKHLVKLFIPALIFFALSLVFYYSDPVNLSLSFYDKRPVELKFSEGNQIDLKKDINASFESISTLSVLQSGYSFKTDASTSAVFYINKYGFFVLDKNSEVLVNSSDENEISLNLISGSIYVDDTHLSTLLSVNTEQALYQVEDSSIFIKSLLSGDEVIGLTNASRITLENTNLNIGLPQNSKIVINQGAVVGSEVLNVFDDNIDEFLKQNLKISKNIKSKFDIESAEALMSKKGTLLSSIKFKIEDFKEMFKVLPLQNKTAVKEKAEFLLANSVDKDEMQNLISYMESLYLSNPEFAKEILKDFNSYFYAVIPGENFYELSEELANLSIKFNVKNALSYKLLRQREGLFDLMALISRGNISLAKTHFLQYEKGMEVLISDLSLDMNQEVTSELIMHKSLIDEMFFGYSDFYDSDLLDTYFNLNTLILSAPSQESLREHYLEDFISTNIGILTSIIETVKDGIANIEIADDFAKRIIIETGFLLEDLSSYSDAESEFYLFVSSKLEEIKITFAFLKSSDFENLTGSFEEGLNIYISKQQDLDELQKYLSTLDSKQKTGTKRVNLSSVIEGIYAEFADEGIEIKDLKSLQDNEYRLFEFGQSVYKGIPFYGKYDSETKVIYDLFIDDQPFKSGVDLSNLSSALVTFRLNNSDQTSQAYTEPVVTEEEDQPSHSSAPKTNTNTKVKPQVETQPSSGPKIKN